MIRPPWTVDIWQNGIVMSDGQNEDVAEFYYDEKHGVSITREEAISHATLCAAALGLLEALEIAEDVLARFPYSSEIWPNGRHPNTGMQKIRAAIAAARAVP